MDCGNEDQIAMGNKTTVQCYNIFPKQLIKLVYKKAS